MAIMKHGTDIKEDDPPIDWSKYGSIYIGTPVHFWTLSGPVRAWVEKYKSEIGRLDEVNAFAAMGGSGHEGAFEQIEQIVGKKLHQKIFTTTPLTWSPDEFKEPIKVREPDEL